MASVETDPRACARWVVAIIGAITILGLLLRLPLFGNALFEDELSTYSIVTGHGLREILHLQYGHSVDLTPPLYYVLSWIAEWFGSSARLLRITSLLAGTGTIPVTYLVGVRTVGRRAAIVAAALVALSPFLIFYSTQARPYALVMLLVLASTFAMLKALAEEPARWWTIYALLSCAAMYTHYTAVFVLAAQFIWAFSYRPNARRALLTANLAALVGFIAWVPALIRQSQSFGAKAFAIIEPFDLSAVTHDLAHWAIGQPWATLSAVPGTVGAVILLFGALLACLGAASNLHGAPSGRTSTPMRSPAALPWVTVLATPVGIALYSLLRESLWDPRNLISSWPGLALVVGWLLATAKRPIQLVALTLTLGGFAAGAVAMLSPGHQRPDYSAAAKLVIHNGSPGDPVAIVAAPGPGPFSAMDAAFTYAGQPGRRLLRIGSPPLAAILHAPPYAFLPASTPSALAQAARVSRGAKLFVIAPGSEPLASLLSSRSVNVPMALGPVLGTGGPGKLMATVFPPLSSFLRAILPQFRPLQTKVFPGVFPVSVYVLARR